MIFEVRILDLLFHYLFVILHIPRAIFSRVRFHTGVRAGRRDARRLLVPQALAASRPRTHL